MFPKSLWLRTILDNSHYVKLCDPFVLLGSKQNGEYCCTHWYDNVRPIDPTGRIFIYENNAYKVTKVAMYNVSKMCTSHCLEGTIEVEEYRDNILANLLARQKEIREHLHVSADRLEELGVLSVANELRERAENITLENLV